MDVLQENAEKIFLEKSGGTKINERELAKAHNAALAELRKIGGEELASASRRGAPPGAAAERHQIPFTSWLFPGHSGVRFREGIQIPAPAGPNVQVPDWLSGYTGQRLAEQIGQIK